MPRRAVTRYINRELSWLEFNHRVLEEALDRKVPLLERLKFLGILSNNLDEFFMVRVAGLKRQLDAAAVEPTLDTMTPLEQDEAVSRRVHKMVTLQYKAFSSEIRPALARAGITFASPDELDADQRRFIASRFSNEICPVLTPMAVDPGHPFPVLLNTEIYIAVELTPVEGRKIRGARLAFVRVPQVVERIIEVPHAGDRLVYVLIEDVIRDNIATLFEGYRVKASHLLRVTRDADLTIDQEGAEDLLKAIELQLKQRPRGSAVRLEIERSAPASLVSRLATTLSLVERDIYRIDGPLNLKPFMFFAQRVDRPDLKDPVFPPVATSVDARNGAIFKAMSRGDILLHHPYQSFDLVIDFLNAAADDPRVLAIKQTLYRTTDDSPIVKALARAAQKGKEVTALVELMARFDEEINIEWAKMLEEAGANVIYGLVGLKTHCKATLVIRREPGGIRRYVHLSTGNYNEVTARVYTDVSLFTADEDFGADASALFNVVTGYSEPTGFRKFVLAPIGLRERLIRLINREADRARAGTGARIIAKMNSLVDRQIIEALYEASKAGVRIDLIVRGICCLRPGVRGTSDNIRVVSIVDRFLEHTRAFYFHNGGQDEYYLSSADWMPRNLDRRIELMFPVQDARLRRRVRHVLDVQLGETVKARRLMSDGSYRRVRGKKKVRCQDELYSWYCAKAAVSKPSNARRFVPRRAPGKT